MGLPWLRENLLVVLRLWDWVITSSNVAKRRDINCVEIIKHFIDLCVVSEVDKV